MKQFNLDDDIGDADRIRLTSFMREYASKIMDNESKRMRFSVLARFYAKYLKRSLKFDTTQSLKNFRTAENSELAKNGPTDFDRSKMNKI